MSLTELTQLERLLTKFQNYNEVTSPLAKENILWVKKYTQGKVQTYSKPKIV